MLGSHITGPVVAIECPAWGSGAQSLVVSSQLQDATKVAPCVYGAFSMAQASWGLTSDAGLVPGLDWGLCNGLPQGIIKGPAPLAVQVQKDGACQEERYQGDGAEGPEDG